MRGEIWRPKPLDLKPIGLKPIGQKPIGLKPIGLKPIGLKQVGLEQIGLNDLYNFVTRKQPDWVFSPLSSCSQIMEALDFETDILGCW